MSSAGREGEILKKKLLLHDTYLTASFPGQPGYAGTVPEM